MTMKFLFDHVAAWVGGMMFVLVLLWHTIVKRKNV